MNKEDNKKKIVKYIHAIQGGTVCNLNCSYCYVPITTNSNKRTPIKFNYSIEHMLKAFSKERIGGLAFINYVGGGETFLSDNTFEVIKGILEEGHCVSVVTNTTITQEIEKLCALPQSLKDRLLVCSSFHFLELKRLNLLETYFSNLNKLKDANISFYINLTICEEYLPYLEEIKELCVKKANILPYVQIAMDAANDWKRYSFYDKKNRKKINKIFDSKISCNINDEIYNKKRKEFCYAGKWSFILDMENGKISQCFAGKRLGNFFDLDKNIDFIPVGHCPSSYCGCGSLLLSCGVIPNLKVPSFMNLYKKNISLNSKINEYLDFKLSDTNIEYSLKNKIRLFLFEYLKKKLKKEHVIS